MRALQPDAVGVVMEALGQLVKLLLAYHNLGVRAGGNVHAGNALAPTWHAFISPEAAIRR